MDINTKKLKKNAFRVTKHRGLTASRIRVPGGHLNAKYLGLIQEIAETYGNGTVHLTTRQGFEVPGIDMKNMDKVNELLQPIIEGLEIIEKAIFPNDLHFKVALTGCPNDCMKVRMHDFGIIGMTEPQLDESKCISCGACVRACTKKSTAALHAENYTPVRDHSKCIGCGECVINCPTGAWTRSKEKYYRLAIMGRTGKKNPRLAEDFLIWADEESIIKIIVNTYKYVEQYIDKNAPGGKEHIGYIVDRTGFEEFKKWALDGVTLSDKAIMINNVYWSGIKYPNI